MEWMRHHLYLASGVSAAIFLIVGFIVVLQHQSVAPITDTPAVWSGGTPGDTTPINPQAQKISPFVNNYGQSETSKVVSPFVEQSATSAPGTTNDNITALFNSFVHPKNTTTTQTGDSGPNVYQYIPQGLISTEAPQTAARTKVQQALYNYGNELGDAIQGMEGQHMDQAAVLKNFAENRQDENAIAALKALGNAYRDMSLFMDSQEFVPAAVKSAHAALSKSYRDLGTKLAAVPDAGEANFLTSIETYDLSARVFVKNFVALALIFPANGVTFSKDEPGSVFMFSMAQ